MGTNLFPRVVSAWINGLGRAGKSESERALERATTHEQRPEDVEPESGEALLARAARQNDTGEGN
jgi:hypothetical protein